MPKAFDECERRGGRIRTIVPNEDEYFRVCYPKGTKGPPIKGETHKKKGK